MNIRRLYMQVFSLVLTSRIVPVRAFRSAHFRSVHSFRPSTDTARFSSSSSDATEEDLLRWEKMFESSGRSSSLDDANNGLPITSKSEVRVVSFDLDNTLWKTGATIRAANDAVADYLNKQNVSQPVRVEEIMGKLFKANKARYCPIEKEEAKAPVSLTLLRKEATQRLLEEHNDYSMEEAAEFAEKVFQVWTDARHAAIPGHLAESVESCLQDIASIRSSDGKPVLIGAITDGNSDPRKVEMLSPFFDFVVNAEQVGVSKPDKRVYLRGVAEAFSHPSLNDLTPGSIDALTEDGMDDDQLEEKLGPLWIHVGDDMLKDVVAAKALNMRTIWARELVMDKFVMEAVEKEDKKSRSVEELVKEVSEMKVVTMEVGASDYLANGLQQEFADAVVDRFSELSVVIKKWHDEAKEAAIELSETAAVTTAENVQPATDAPPSVSSRQQGPETAKTKFCMFCGESVPNVANFCPHCGEKQEV